MDVTNEGAPEGADEGSDEARCMRFETGMLRFARTLSPTPLPEGEGLQAAADRR
jgi:hypothetical protein